MECERIVSDIKDFEPSGVAQLGSKQPWVCMGKHLCGSATDFALLCLARSAACSADVPEALPHNCSSSAAVRMREAGTYEQATSSRADRSDEDPAGARRGLQGFAIATCCHHRCSWEHYTGRELFRQHGMSKADFQLAAWMTGESCLGAHVHARPELCCVPPMLMSSGCSVEYAKGE